MNGSGSVVLCQVCVLGSWPWPAQNWLLQLFGKRTNEWNFFSLSPIPFFLFLSLFHCLSYFSDTYIEIIENWSTISIWCGSVSCTAHNNAQKVCVWYWEEKWPRVVSALVKKMIFCVIFDQWNTWKIFIRLSLGLLCKLVWSSKY